MKIKIVAKRFDGKGTFNQVFEQNEKGQWSAYLNGEDMGKVLEEDVIHFVKKHDRKNLHKYFPMANFHN